MRKRFWHKTTIFTSVQLCYRSKKEVKTGTSKRPCESPTRIKLIILELMDIFPLKLCYLYLLEAWLSLVPVPCLEEKQIRNKSTNKDFQKTCCTIVQEQQKHWLFLAPLKQGWLKTFAHCCICMARCVVRTFQIGFSFSFGYVCLHCHEGLHWSSLLIKLTHIIG